MTMDGQAKFMIRGILPQFCSSEGNGTRRRPLFYEQTLHQSPGWLSGRIEASSPEIVILLRLLTHATVSLTDS